MVQGTVGQEDFIDGLMILGGECLWGRGLRWGKLGQRDEDLSDGAVTVVDCLLICQTFRIVSLCGFGHDANKQQNVTQEQTTLRTKSP